MQAVDLLVVGVYLIAVVWFGARLSRRQTGIRDYFLTDRRVPWWAVMGSIVATETSTVTLISVPGYAFGADLTFLQLAIGYLAGKLLVALLLIPPYFRSELLTAYQLLAQQFGPAVGRVAAVIFLATRSLSDGFRLFATGLVLAAVLATLPGAATLAAGMAPGLARATTLLVVGVCLIGVTTLVYTLLGGMRAVIWTDVIQLAIYLGGAVVAALVLLATLPGGWSEVIAAGAPTGKFVLLDFSWELSRSYTFWSGLVGGAFLTGATHGTDQMFVQRYLCSRSARDARRALVVSGFVVIVQFALFLLIGVMLWVYYTAHAPEALAAITRDGQLQTDRIFPLFMMSHLPVGLRGLMVAAIVAAAMSTLSSSLNSSAASTVGDFYMPWTAGVRSDAHYLRVSRWATIGWAVVQVGVALVAIELSSRVVDEVLGIQSFTGGLMLGLFLIGGLTATRSPVAVGADLVIGAVATLAVRVLTDVSWQWYALVGSLTTLGVSYAVERIHGNAAPEDPARA